MEPQFEHYVENAGFISDDLQIETYTQKKKGLAYFSYNNTKKCKTNKLYSYRCRSNKLPLFFSYNFNISQNLKINSIQFLTFDCADLSERSFSCSFLSFKV